MTCCLFAGGGGGAAQRSGTPAGHLFVSVIVEIWSSQLAQPLETGHAHSHLFVLICIFFFVLYIIPHDQNLSISYHTPPRFDILLASNDSRIPQHLAGLLHQERESQRHLPAISAVGIPIRFGRSR